MNKSLWFVSALVVSSLLFVVDGVTPTVAFAQDATKFTACVNRKGKIKFLAEGEDPLKSCNGRQIQIMFPSSDKTDRLTEDVIALDEKTVALMAKDMQLMEDVGLLQSEQEELKHQVDGLLERRIFSMIGGATGDDGFCCSEQNIVRYMGLFVSRLAEQPAQVQQPMTDVGFITDFRVSVDPAVAADTAVTYTLFAGGGAAHTCIIAPGETSCSSDACRTVFDGDQLYVQIEASAAVCPPENANCAEIPTSRWIAEFTPGKACAED